MAEFFRVADAGELAPGQAKCVEVAGKKIALFNLDGSFYAIDDTCRAGYNCHPRVSLWRSRPPGYITRLGGSRDGAPREREFR